MSDVDTDQGRATIARVVRRLVPFIFVCYVVAYIDRVNIGFAKAELQRDLGLSDAAYGLGGGLFFLGYCLFEIPSNLVLERVGARLWIARIMIVWGLVSMAMMFVVGHVELLRDAGPARHRRGGVLPRHGAVSDLLGAGRRAREDRCALHDRRTRRRADRLAGVRGAARARWAPGPGRMAVAVPGGRLPGGRAWRRRVVVPHRSARAGRLAASCGAGVAERRDGARTGGTRGPSSGIASEGAPERTRAAHLLHLLPQHARVATASFCGCRASCGTRRATVAGA